MRRLFAALFTVAACGAVAAPASAGVGVPTHGADPRAVDRGPEVAVPAFAGAAAARRRARGAEAAPWCGDARPDDDRRNEVDTGGARYHAVLLHAADRAPRLGEVAAGLQRDVLQSSALLERLYGRAIRFDFGTACGSRYLDISVVRMPQSTADLERLAQTPTGTIEAAARALDLAGHPTTKAFDYAEAAARRDRNYAVWLDAPGPRGSCGQATLYDDPVRDQANANNAGGKVALIFREGRGFCDSNTLRHEIAHNLGALQPGAPNAFDGAHCNDAYEDTMCYASAARRGDGRFQQAFFDFGNDDYWDPPAGPPLRHWTVNLSRFVCPDAGCNGVGAGAATVSSPTLRLRTRKLGRDRWEVGVRAEGRGSARVTIRCRRPGRRAVAGVLSRRTALPADFTAKVACASRPTAGAAPSAH